jgi:uncharacterized protein YfaS (alpha-2-macroglobulin family)
MNTTKGRIHATLALLVSLATACSSKPPSDDSANKLGAQDASPAATGRTIPEEPPGTPPTMSSFEPVVFADRPELRVTLKSGRAEGESIIPRVAPQTANLTAEQTKLVLARMPVIVTDGADEKDFAMRDKTTPPPRPGETVKDAFPPLAQAGPPPAATVDKNAPLKVARFAPEGEVPLAPFVSVTFDQPMVAITSHEDTIAKGVPATIEPAVPGKWRWVGAKTLMFEPESSRFAMATEYKVTIPADTKSINGQPLGKAVTWSFATPAPALETYYPSNYDTFALKQVMVLRFNQRIDQQTALANAFIKTGRVIGSAKPVLATQAEIDADPEAASIVASSKEGTWIAFKAEGGLPYDSPITFGVNAGFVGAEGPRKTTSALSASFRTHGPLKVNSSRCGYNKCTPNDAFDIELSNRLEGFDASMVKIDPPIPGVNIQNYGDRIYIHGTKPGRRKYTVTLSKDIKDRFGQTLGEDKSLTFDVGPSYPTMYAAGDEFIVLDPASPPSFSIFSINYSKIKVEAYEVEPKDWGAYLEFHRDWDWRGKNKKSPPGKRVMSEIVSVGGEADDVVETKIALEKALGGDKLGNLVLHIEPVEIRKGAPVPEYHSEYKPRVRSWIQATQIGLDGFADQTEFLAWTTNLASGEPLDGVAVELAASGVKGQTDKQGVASLELAVYSSTWKQSGDMLIATKGKDVAFLPERQGYYGSGSTSWYQQKRYDTLQWFVFDDRKMYRPSEEVHIKGWARAMEHVEGGDLKGIGAGKPLTFTVTDSYGNPVASGASTTTALGGFDFKFSIPGTPSLGEAIVQINISGVSAGNTTHYHAIMIQEFRRPEFEVKASAPPGPFFADRQASVEVQASYYAGGGLASADTNWHVTTSEASYRPPNLDKFSFGTWTPWWVTYNTPAASVLPPQTYQGKTDALGLHPLKLEFSKISPPKPMTVQAQATVMDVNRQAWTSSTSLLVHPSQHYVGLRSDKYFVEKDEPLKIQIVASDIDGNLLAGRPVKVRASRTNWTWKNGKYQEEQADVQVCDVMSEAKEVTCTFKTDVGGSYKIAATTSDDYGRLNYSEITRWVSGGKLPASKEVELERVEMIPQQEQFAPEDTAKILVQSPFFPAEALMTIRRNGMVEQRRFTMSGPTTTIEVPVKRAYIPNFYVQVDLVGNAPRLNAKGEADDKLPRRPAYATGSLNIQVPPNERKLAVEVTPAATELEPAATTSLKVMVKDAAGKPVKDAEVAVVVVDESVLALSGYLMADPMNLFYVARPTDTRDYHLRGDVLLVDPAALQIQGAQGADGAAEGDAERGGLGAMGSGRGGGSKGKRMESPKAAPAMRMQKAEMADALAPAPSMIAEESKAMDRESGAFADNSGAAPDPSTPIAVRTNFNPLAAFAPAVRTDSTGTASVELKMPDNLTRYRIMAVAVAGEKQFGAGESNVTARLPLMIRPSAPRFLNFGDKFELPVVVQNQTGEPMEVKVAVRSTNVELINANGMSVKVPARDRVELRFAATTAKAGTARFQVAGAAGQFADAAEFNLPVWTPATTEAFATYGVIDQGAIAQPVKMPSDVWPQFGGLEISTSSTAVQALTDAFIYLYRYQFECAEQISSRMVTVAALRDVLTAFKAKDMPSAKEIEASMARDIDELFDRQNYDGGFGLWRSGQPSWPYVSIHATHALVRAQKKGYKVPADKLARALAHLKSIERHIPYYYGAWSRRHIRAYALYVRSLTGDRDIKEAKRLMREAKLENHSFEAIGWLLGTLTGDKTSDAELAELRTFLNNRVTETAAGAHFATSFDADAYLVMSSDRAADAVIMEALIDDQPKSDLIPKLVRDLLAHRKRGRWGNTQENAFVLLALDKYFNTYENQTPDFIARAWLGDSYAGEHKFKGRTTEHHQIDIPMAYLAKMDGQQPLTLQKDGKGRMYYRVGMSYAPKSLYMAPAEHGFSVERVYEPMDNDNDVKRLADGAWEIRAGARVRIKLTMVAPSRRYHVALVDPLPAGLEALNPDLAVTGDLPQENHQTEPSGWWWWSRPWYEHQNMRDERVEAFATYVWGGVYTYTYYARATTPGNFVVPPTKAEEMYNPETFGRSASDRVIVKD